LGAAQALHYWEQKGHLSPQSFLLVQWDILHAAISTYSLTFQMWLSKFASGHSVVGVTMFCWKKRDSAVCPVCMQHDETIAHVFTCSHPSRRMIWVAQVEQLWQWMIQADTAPDIISCLIPTLSHYGSSMFSLHATPLCHLAALDQDAIGFLAVWWDTILYLGILFEHPSTLPVIVNVQLGFGPSGCAISFCSSLMLCGVLAMIRFWQLVKV